MVPMPQKKGDILPWAEEVSRDVNGLSSIGSAGLLTRSGAAGFGFESLPQNLRERRSQIPGCFEIRRPSPAATEGGEEDPGGFDNPYFTVGAHLYQCADAIDMGFDYDDCIVALCVNTTSASPEAYVESFTDFTELQETAKNRSVAIHPLYLLGEGGTVLADLRNIPVFPQWEHKED